MCASDSAHRQIWRIYSSGFIEVLGAAVSVMSSSSTYGVASNKGGVKALEEETAREMIDKLAKDEGNDVCADCGEVSECSN